MRYLLLILWATACFAFDADYSACIDENGDTLTSDYHLSTIPANGSYGASVDEAFKILTPRLCTGTYPPGWYGADQGACFFVQGKYFPVIDTVVSGSGAWTVSFNNSPAHEYRDTIGMCLEDLAGTVWTTRPIDTIYVASNALEAWDSTNVIHAAACDSTICDTCAYIISCDTALAIRYDTLVFLRDRDWAKFYEIEWFIRQYTVTGWMYDTVSYVTEGDTKIAVYQTPFTFTGTSATGTDTVFGWRSGGMDIYCDFGKVVTAVDSAEVGMRSVDFSFTWPGFTHGKLDTLRVWGVTPEGVHSDTTKVTRRYANTRHGTFRPR